MSGNDRQLPLVSLITPSLNPGGRIKRCLSSVRAQTYPRIEHLIIDGGSNDGTLELLRHGGIRFVSEPDEGQADAINKGFQMANGQLLGWLNADDQLTPTAVETVVASFRAHEHVGLVIGCVVVVSEGRAELERPADPARESTWRARSIGPQPGSLNARWALEKVGYLDSDFHYTMDFDLWLRMIDAGVGARRVDEVLAVFEVHANSKSGSIPHSLFLCEEATSRLRSGRIRDGSFAVGRAAAWVAQEKQILFPLALDLALTAVGYRRDLLSHSDVLAGFRVERGILAGKTSAIKALPMLADYRSWLNPTARSRLLHVIERATTRRKRQAVDSKFIELLQRFDV